MVLEAAPPVGATPVGAAEGMTGMLVATELEGATVAELELQKS